MKYIALLRGINVGGNNRVEMPRLKVVFESLGYASVLTYINSGNVVFESARTEVSSEQIEEAIEAEFGFRVKVVIVSEKNLRHIAEQVPDEWTHDSLVKRCEALFLWPEIDEKAVLEKIFKTDVDELVYFPGAVVWRMERKDYNQSGMTKLVGSEVYKKSTVRNINTVRKLAELLDKSP